MVMIYNQFNEALQNQGLRRIETVGQPFDPNVHDAVATDPDSSAPVNTIIEEFQPGYMFQNRVLRPALVRVSTNGATGNSSKRKDGSR
jgi:molecular chaperone GrpE